MNAPNPAATEATAAEATAATQATATEATAATQATAATEIAATAASAAPEVPALTPIQASEGPAAAPPAATASPQKSHQVLNQALQHLSSGKRNLLVNDVNAAVTALAESCQLLGQHYGETAVECAESYFYYGKALLELARMENGVLDNVMTGVPDGEDTDSSQVEDPDQCTEAEMVEVAEQVDQALAENYEQLEHPQPKESVMPADGEDKENQAQAANVPAVATPEAPTVVALKARVAPTDGAGEKMAEDSPSQPQGSADPVGPNDPGVQTPIEASSRPDQVDAQAAIKTPQPDQVEAQVETQSPVKEGAKPAQPPAIKVGGQKNESEESAEDEDAEEVDQPSPETDDTKKEVDPEAEGGETEKSTEGDEGNTSQDDDSQEEENGEADGNESIGSNEAGTSDNKEAKDKSATENEEEEDPSNLQLAWEMFELSKICFQKHADSLGDNDPKRMEMENRLCEAYQMLGELSVESENYPQAIDDLTSCLRRRQELLPNDSRCIAETHYQMGVALGFSLEFDKAVEALNDAIGVLQTRIDNLKNKTESDDPMSKKDAFYTREKEITEIESLIPEIKEKIADTKDMQNETVRKLGDRALLEERELEATSSAAAPKTNGEASTTNGFGAPPKEASSGSKPTSDISNLIKKRKKSESEEVPVTKKSHVEANGTNGAAKTVENGDGDAK